MEKANQKSKQQQQQQKQKQQGRPLPVIGFSNGSKAHPSTSSSRPPNPAAAAAAAKSPPLPKRPSAAASPPAAAAAAPANPFKKSDAGSWRVRRRPPAFVPPETSGNGASVMQQQTPSDLITQESPSHPPERASARTGRSRDRSAATAATTAAAAAATAGITTQPSHFPPPPMPPYCKERSSGSLRAPIIFSLCFPGWFSRQTAGKGVKIPVAKEHPPKASAFSCFHTFLWIPLSRGHACSHQLLVKVDVRIDPPPELVPFLPPQLPKDQVCYKMPLLQRTAAAGAAAAGAAAAGFAAAGGKKTLVLDLDETLVRSTFAKPAVYNFIIKVDLDGKERSIYINKRPGVTMFLNEVAKLFEVVIFTASVSKRVALPFLPDEWLLKRTLRKQQQLLLLLLDGVFVKDLSLLGRDLKSTIIIDNSTRAYLWHAENAIPIKSWFEDPHDRELLDLIPILQSLASVQDIRPVIRDVLVRLN
ncbi:hypothetical protein ACSSS7_007066 [Eimeria intestinalis]